jgi:small-conductance mechanosensitive channel
MKKIVFLYCFIAIVLSSSFAAGQTASEEISLEGVAPGQVDSVLAKLSDEQVRSLLLTELSKDLETGSSEPKASGGLVGKATGLLHLLDKEKGPQETKAGSIFSSIGQIPLDYIAVAKKIGNGSFLGFIVTVLLLVAVFGAASLAEFFVRRYTANFRKQFQEKAIPDLDGPMRFVAGLMRSIPSFLHILVFSVTAVLFFFIIPVSNHEPVRNLFLMLLTVFVFYRILIEVSRILCSPGSSALRVLPVDDATARTVHNAVMLLCTYTFGVIMFLALLMELQLGRTSFRFTVIILAALLIGIIISMILRSRDYVKNRILQTSEMNKTRNWVVEQFAQFWHVPVVLYFAIIGMILVGDQLAGVQRENSAFLLSLLILPLFILFDSVGQWVARISIKTLRMYNPDDEDSADEELIEKLVQAREKERKLSVTTGRMVRLIILAALLVWALSLWGYTIPYAVHVTSAIFESLLTVALGLTAWRFISSYIEKKIAEATPEEEEKEDSDDEFGASTQRGRSYTLLPMLRKFIATILLVMVSMVVLSSIGVDIGPLLAGAGVVGLAIGFGAQKMVSDIFSGFFYLLDDAFRVGEYIQAGSVSGAVESITLRNVMLRHHRGMLQIVPYSELGSITNFMRGGLVVKFNLEFPYDTDIDKVRKIIKKVGIAMLADEEFGQDFIRPVKSQGVREISGSVMIIRVKFTAQPGTQFVIQREAFRRITEALVAKGIHYAHRKVIVELPQSEEEQSAEEKKKALEAGAAAALARLEEEEKKKNIS